MPFFQFMRNDGPYSFIVLGLTLLTWIPAIASVGVAFWKPARAAIPVGIASAFFLFVSFVASARGSLVYPRDDAFTERVAPGTRELLNHMGSVAATTTPKVAFFGLLVPFFLTASAAVIGLVRAEKRSVLGSVFAGIAALGLVAVSFFSFRAPLGRELTADEAEVLDWKAKVDSPASVEEACVALKDNVERRSGRSFDVRKEIVGEAAIPEALAKACVSGMDAGKVTKLPFAKSEPFLALLDATDRAHVKSFAEPPPDELGLGLLGINLGNQDLRSFRGPKSGLSGLEGLHKDMNPGDPIVRPSTTGAAVRQGPATVSGRLPPEVIQRVIRQRMSRFRYCYQVGLRKNPALEGRVVPKFVIGRSGDVVSVEDGGSDLPDPDVKACIFQQIRTTTFPQPEAGIVTVTYPMTFKSAG